MAKKKKKKKIEEGEVPLSAMIDVVFLLLIYFVITYSSTPVEAHIAMNLPASSQQESDQQKFEVWVLPEADAYVFRGIQKLTYNQVEQRFREYLAVHTADEMTVTVKVHKDTTHEKLVQFLDLCAEFNCTKLNVNMLAEHLATNF